MHTLIVDRIGLQGDGIAKSPQGDVFVPFSLPGEQITGTIENQRIVAAVVQASSPDRVTPVCPQFGICGGCALQHASDEFLAVWKVETVRRALSAQGISAPMRNILVSPAHSRRRATFAGRRTKKTVQIGFHARASDQLVESTQCYLVRPELLALRPALEALVKTGASRSAALRLTVTTSMAGPDVDVRDGKPPDGPMRAALGHLAQEHRLARLSWNGEVVAMAEPPVQRFGRALVLPPPGAFLQASIEGEGALVASVLEAVQGAGRVMDLFAGCGTFALPLAEQAEVHAVESESQMLAALDAGWRMAVGLKKVTTETRDLFRRPILPGELAKTQAVVIDPPRAGAEAQVREVAASKVPLIAMVSCNPITFARDARVLVTAGFSLDWLQVVDQFRWSGHVELVARFSR